MLVCKAQLHLHAAKGFVLSGLFRFRQHCACLDIGTWSAPAWGPFKLSCSDPHPYYPARYQRRLSFLSLYASFAVLKDCLLRHCMWASAIDYLENVGRLTLFPNLGRPQHSLWTCRTRSTRDIGFIWTHCDFNMDYSKLSFPAQSLSSSCRTPFPQNPWQDIQVDDPATFVDYLAFERRASGYVLSLAFLRILAVEIKAIDSWH